MAADGDDYKHLDELEDALAQNDGAAVRTLVGAHAELNAWLDECLVRVSKRNQMAMMDLLVELGAHINLPPGKGFWESPIDRAAGEGALEAVRWLLDHGAVINDEQDGERRCLPLTGAAMDGHLDVVKLLVEHGADVNTTFADRNALSLAMKYGKSEVVAYLRSIGAKTPEEIRGEAASAQELVPEGSFQEHIERHLGHCRPLSIQEIVPFDPPVTIHIVEMPDRIALVTEGMARRRGSRTVPVCGTRVVSAHRLASR